jgi:apurinic endonuclease APN1
MQAMAHQLGGTVSHADHREFGYAEVRARGHTSLLKDIQDFVTAEGHGMLKVWMSHGDQVTRLPDGFKVMASTDSCPIAGMADEARRFYAVQFHPEVTHTIQGQALLNRFVKDICACTGDWTMPNYVDEAIARIGAGIGEALDAVPGTCSIYLENTAGAGDTIGRTFEQLRAVADAAGHEDRVGFCLDTQHMFASGFPIHEEGGIDRVLDEFDRIVGIDRLKSLHLNDSKTEFGSNRDRHENLGEGLIGEDGFRRILGHPALQGLPVILEVPGEEGEGPDAVNMERARRLHEEGLALRS